MQPGGGKGSLRSILTAAIAVPLLGALLLSCSGGTEAADRSATTAPASTTTTSALAVDDSEQPSPDDRLPIEGALAYVGCSVTRDTVVGYHTVGGERFWPVEAEYGGTIGQLRDRRRLDLTWDVYDRLSAAVPPVAVWWQLCLSSERDSSDEELYAFAVDALGLLRDHAGDVPVFVSPLPVYEPPAECKKIGPDGPQRLAVVADGLVESGLALRGPELPSLHEAELRDRCHPNEDGQAIQGRTLLEFFG